MVSIHDTSKYHNYLVGIKPQEFVLHPNTILDYIHTNHPIIYNNISNNMSLFNKLNSLHLNYTFFMVIDEDVTSNMSLDYLYNGHVNLDIHSMLVSESGKSITIMNNKVNGSDILFRNIKLQNGVINIIKKNFSSNK